METWTCLKDGSGYSNGFCIAQTKKVRLRQLLEDARSYRKMTVTVVRHNSKSSVGLIIEVLYRASH